MIDLERVSLQLGDTRVLQDVSFSHTDPAYIALVGPSGSGKSTLLRCIAGLLTPDQGTIRLAGEALFDRSRALDVPPEQRHIGMVFQSYAVWPHMTVRDNVGYPLKMRKLGQAERENRVRAALDAVSMGALSERSPATLSGGQQQRVALARVLASEPKALLLDEPLANLDPHLRAELSDEFRRVFRERQLPVIHVTHDREEALSLATSVVVLNHGRIEQAGSPETIFTEPQNRFVAEFMTRGSTLLGTLEHDRDGWSLRHELGALPLPTDPRLATGTQVAVVVPHHGWRVSPERHLGARVEDLAYAGTHWVAVCQFAGLKLRIALPRDLARPTTGDTLPLTISAASVFAHPPA